MTTAAGKKICPVSPFGIEADTRLNGDVIIQSIPGCRLRGAIRAGKMAKREEDSKFGPAGEEFPPESMNVYGMLPAMPGMQLHVNPANLEYTIYDPLYENQDLLDKFQAKLAAIQPYSSKTKLRGLAPKKGTLDADRMKTLCRELWQMVSQYEMAKVVKGVLPDMEDIDALDGNYLLNPGATIQNYQPRYEKDMPEYERNISKLGAT